MERPGMEEDLALLGRVALLETRGRRSAMTRRTAVGYVEEADGSILVSAGDPGADWARNLLEDPRCRVTIGDATSERTAEILDGADHADAVTRLILRYGTPAERLGRGPSFRLRQTG